MKIGHFRSLALAIAASLGIEAVAIAAEPVAGDKIKGTTQPKKEAHGLLASRIANLAPPKLEEPAAQHSAIEPLAPPAFQTASWSELASDTLSSNTSSSLSCTDGCCNTCDCCPDPLWCHRC